MPFYPVTPPDVTPACAADAAPGLPGLAGMVAVRVADLAWPAGRGLGEGGRAALVAAAAAGGRGGGRVQARGHPADHVRLGVAEERLDVLTGRPGVIGEIAASAVLGGKVKGTARRAMTPALAIRFILLMTLMPDADYAGVMAALAGDLAGVPWQRPY